MRLFKSIKWRLQIWYGLILMVVLAGFGVTAYQMERGRQFQQIDQELQRRVGVLVNSFRRPPPHGGEGDNQFFNPPPRGQFPDARPPLQRNRPFPEFNLSEWDAHFFEASDPHRYYFIITTRDNKEIARSTNQPERTVVANAGGYRPGKVNQVNNLPSYQPKQFVNYDNYREVVNDLPSGENILVGCSILPELKQLHHTALNLAMAGALILLVGFTGGWWLISHSLKPISTIGATAVKISAGDLSQRINVAETESELGQLAAVLNSTFARLETAFAQQKQFASDAAHELRTPVSVILTQAQTALNRERDAASYKLTVEACQRAAQRMRKLIESLLELARFDAGQEVLNRAQFDLSRAISDSIELIQPLAEQRQIKIVSQLSPAEINGDAGRLGQVITNLLTNAIQYNQPGGGVRVNLETQNGMAVLTVADTGQGISAKDVPHIFERFYRADASRTGASNAGLGLSICKAIVEAHGGTIEAQSESGKGSTFTVRLPV